MSLQAYQQAATRAESPRDLEYRLFGQVTRALMEAAKLDRMQIAQRIDAIDWNRRLWSVLSSDCSDPSNKLPPQVRANIISLSIFVHKHSKLVMRGEEDFETLIEINRTMMQALAPRNEAPAAA
jgi:flagellar biosynthesis activator protein FlaF